MYCSSCLHQLRDDSLNTRLAGLAADTIEAGGAIADVASMREFDMSRTTARGDERAVPAAAEEYAAGSRRSRVRDLLARIQRVDPGRAQERDRLGVAGSSTAVQWRHGMLLSASPSMIGGNRGLWALRVPLEHLGARIYPDMFSLAQAHRRSTIAGRLADPPLQERLETTIAGFLELVEAAMHYPRIKKAWVEFLGERPDPVIDRVE